MTDSGGMNCPCCIRVISIRKINIMKDSVTLENWARDYLDRQSKLVGALPVDRILDWVALLREANLNGQQIFVCGNGANAANASHFATDLGKGASDAFGKRFRILSLNDNTPWMTAIGNDYDFADVFLRQMQNYAQSGDLLIVSSVSGSSPNLVRAVEWANSHDMRTLAMVGAKGGKLAELAQKVIILDDTHYGRVEDAQMMIYHMLCYAFIE